MRGLATTVGVVATLMAAIAGASTTLTVKVGATVREVQCTAEQRLRIRACAEGVQSIAAMPFKSASLLQVRPDAPPVYKIEVDNTRKVLVRTILY